MAAWKNGGGGATCTGSKYDATCGLGDLHAPPLTPGEHKATGIYTRQGTHSNGKGNGALLPLPDSCILTLPTHGDGSVHTAPWPALNVGTSGSMVLCIFLASALGEHVCLGRHMQFSMPPPPAACHLVCRDTRIFPARPLGQMQVLPPEDWNF
jgi:hypothetical protein